MTVIAAARDAARRLPGGIQAAAIALRKSESALYKEFTSQGTAKLGVFDLVSICLLTKDHSIAQAFCQEVGGVFIPLAAGDDARDMASIGAAVKEFAGEWAKDVADGEVTANELARIEHEGLEAISAIVRMIGQARDAYETARPGHVRPGSGAA